MDWIITILAVSLIITVWCCWCAVSDNHEQYRKIRELGDHNEKLSALCKHEQEQNAITYKRLKTARADSIDSVIQFLELDSDLRRIKLSIWGTAEIDRNASDIEKLIAEWRKEIADVGLRIADLETALRDANQVCNTAHTIANRFGRETNWGPFAAKIEESLERQHRVLNGGNRAVGSAQSAIADPQSAIA
jgi:hypothetical protein